MITVTILIRDKKVGALDGFAFRIGGGTLLLARITGEGDVEVLL